jgi:N-acetylglucosamine-6-phosphate deacetylase
MPVRLFSNARLITPSGPVSPGWLLVEGSCIDRLGPGQPPAAVQGPSIQAIDCQGGFLMPGFIDLHVHGALGHEVMDANPEGLRAMARFYAAHGVTGFLATTWTASQAAIRKVLNNLGPLTGAIPGGASLLGIHLEGPYLNPARCGAQDVDLIRRAEPVEAMEFLDTGLVRLVALAPEFPENLWLVDECLRRGITVAAGHTAATYEQMASAVQRGVRQVTHCYNAMSPLHHRAPGVVGAALTMPEIRCELIADKIHVHPGAMQLAYQAKGPDGIILITDAIRGTGLPEGEYPIDDHRRMTIKDHAARLPDGTLAGSVLTLERGLFNFAAAANRPFAELWAASSRSAAQAIGLDQCKGSLLPGYDADLVLLDEDVKVKMTVVNGEPVYIEPKKNAGKV